MVDGSSGSMGEVLWILLPVADIPVQARTKPMALSSSSMVLSFFLKLLTAPSIFSVAAGIMEGGSSCPLSLSSSISIVSIPMIGGGVVGGMILLRFADLVPPTSEYNRSGGPSSSSSISTSPAPLDRVAVGYDAGRGKAAATGPSSMLSWQFSLGGVNGTIVKGYFRGNRGFSSILLCAQPFRVCFFFASSFTIRP